MQDLSWEFQLEGSILSDIEDKKWKKKMETTIWYIEFGV